MKQLRWVLGAALVWSAVVGMPGTPRLRAATAGPTITVQEPTDGQRVEGPVLKISLAFAKSGDRDFDRASLVVNIRSLDSSGNPGSVVSDLSAVFRASWDPGKNEVSRQLQEPRDLTTGRYWLDVSLKDKAGAETTQRTRFQFAVPSALAELVEQRTERPFADLVTFQDLHGAINGSGYVNPDTGSCCWLTEALSKTVGRTDWLPDSAPWQDKVSEVSQITLQLKWRPVPVKDFGTTGVQRTNVVTSVLYPPDFSTVRQEAARQGPGLMEAARSGVSGAPIRNGDKSPTFYHCFDTYTSCLTEAWDTGSWGSQGEFRDPTGRNCNSEYYCSWWIEGDYSAFRPIGRLELSSTYSATYGVAEARLLFINPIAYWAADVFTNASWGTRTFLTTTYGVAVGARRGSPPLTNAEAWELPTVGKVTAHPMSSDPPSKTDPPAASPAYLTLDSGLVVSYPITNPLSFAGDPLYLQLKIDDYPLANPACPAPLDGIYTCLSMQSDVHFRTSLKLIYREDFPAICSTAKSSIRRAVRGADTPSCRADLAAGLSTARAGPFDPVIVGSPVTHTVTIANNGPDAATSVKLSLTQQGPAGSGFKTGPIKMSQGDCSSDLFGEWFGNGVCSLGDIAGSGVVTGTFVVTPTSRGALTTTVTVTGQENDPNGGNNTVTLPTRVAELELMGLEVTQAVQNWRNSVPLITNRPTFVRAHLRAVGDTDPVRRVPAELHGTRGGLPLPGSPLKPVNPGSTLDVEPDPDRSSVRQSFLFQLPPAWLTGTVQLEFRGVNYGVTCRPNAEVNPGSCKVAVLFEPSVVPSVRFVPVLWTDDKGKQHGVTPSDFVAAAREIEKQFPIPHLQWSLGAEYSTGEQPKTIPDWGSGPFEKTIAYLQRLRAIDGCEVSAGCNTYYVGLIAEPSAETSDTGLTLNTTVKPLEFTAYRYDVPHEFGHALGRRHVRARGDEGNPDLSYPYVLLMGQTRVEGAISDAKDGEQAFYGFDIFERTAKKPLSQDLMSYGSPRWISDYTYRALKDALKARYGATSPRSVRAAADTPSVLVSGVVSPSAGIGRIGSIYAITATAAITPGSGSYLIRIENSQGQAVGSLNFEPGHPTEGAADRAPFTVRLPWPADAARIVLVKDGQTLDARQAPANTPTVAIVSPQGGESLSGATAVLEWSAGHPDGLPLSYAVQYSDDAGKTWRTLTVDWSSTRYEVDLTTLPGSEQALWRVLASDGFHTVQAQSSAPFRVARHAPWVSIQSPEENRLMVGEQPVFFEGAGYGIEDGQLEDAQLKWTSDRAGTLGTGRTLVVNASALAEGTHVVTLTGRASDGQTGSAQVSLKVSRQLLRATDFVPVIISGSAAGW